MIEAEVRPGRWADSARLMAAAREAEGRSGVDRVGCFMATPANLEDARRLGLWHDALQRAGPDDLVIVASGSDPGQAIAAAARALDGRPSGAAGGAAHRAPRALRAAPADLALISVPGDYAALEAHKALGAGMDVMIFSDGVALDDEVALKRRAHRLGRLVMGPGCGTALLDGVGLGFANVVAAGPVGVVSAAGTGAQEVMVLLDRHGTGVSRCYGTGGRDLTADVGAVTTLDAIDRLARDPSTEVILCVSKPPDPEVARGVLGALSGSGKPAVACLVGAAADPPPGVSTADTLEEAALLAARAAGREVARPKRPQVDWVVRGSVFGLFSGGTLCSEASAILAATLGDVASNAPAGRARKLAEGEAPRGHVVLDLGEEEFTRSRPHPMIDPQARTERLRAAAADHRVGVILLDVVLGHASHPDPAGALAPVLAKATSARPPLAMVAHVLGTEADPQRLSVQEATLRDVGVHLCPTNAAAARLAAALAG